MVYDGYTRNLHATNKSKTRLDEFLFTNRADGDKSEAILTQSSERDAYTIHIMIWDGVSFHPGNTDPRLTDNMDLLLDWRCNRRWYLLDDLLEAATYLKKWAEEILGRSCKDPFVGW